MKSHTNVDTTLLANRIPTVDHVYVVGPFAGRVSFGSQQRRAINLAWAINVEFKKRGILDGLRGKKIAVVGASLSGLTLSVALSAFKCDVWGFEKQENELRLFEKADHRNIHPTINFWPHEEIIPTTEFPFMNWYEGKCTDIIKQVRKEWIRHRNSNVHLRGYEFDRTVKGVEKDKNSNQWKLKFQPAGKKRTKNKKLYDAVIFCTGFGLEKGLQDNDTPSYWDSHNDIIEEVQKINDEKLRFKNVVVSGTGDGGLIECLRLLYRVFKAGDIVEPAKYLHSDETIASRLQEVETTAQKILFDSAAIEPGADSEQIRDDISEYLWKKYRDIYEEDLPDDQLLEFLDNNRTVVPKLILLGRRPYPFELDASPYHRFLITNCIMNGLIEYCQIKDRTELSACPSTLSDTSSPELLKKT